MDAFGLVNDQAKAELWRHERLPLYIELVHNETRQVEIAPALDTAEKGAGALWSATFWCAMYQLLPPPPGDREGRKQREEKMRERERRLPKNKKTKENDLTRLVREMLT